MKVVCIINARGNSKGLPGKNIRMFGDKPLIAHTIESAINSKICDRVVVSTDDEKIAEMKNVLESDDVPEINKSCEHCAYLDGGKKF